MPAPTSTTKPLKVAIVGAGPGGLAAAIQFRRLPDIELSIYDQARELREVGAGIALNQNSWRQLRELGAAEDISQYHTRQTEDKIAVEQRIGRTGELIYQRKVSGNPDQPPAVRIERTVLQRALINRLPKDLVQLSKKLDKYEETDAGVTLTFKDGTTAGPFDLVVGADGIRSAVRHQAYPDHQLSYTGKVAFRVLIPQERVAHLEGIPSAATWWHTPDTHVYTLPLDNGQFEIATRAIENEEHGQKVSWGQIVQDKERVRNHYTGYTKLIRDIIDTVEDGEWQEFALFGGPLLPNVTRNGRIVLLGDASHPLSGAFGSAGAAFAFEDAFVLAKVIEFARTNAKSQAYALDLFDDIRQPRFEYLYSVLNHGGSNLKAVRDEKLQPDDHVREVIRRNWAGEGRKPGDQGDQIYAYNVQDVWAAREKEEKDKIAKVTKPVEVEKVAEQLAAVTVAA
ncbi:FAD-dependent monooxygenase SAT7 [Vanrija pseudolonga]|uniref:FAD-dependent monooxygenase SAT7 n=1 Tax=Vanrija pseudolonga TaxID=143232 RepID=A0AAF1BGX4_9TREE|nr:FAD-dependent monooxygenase SAT7 [Vanrija pseudolonga]